MKIIFLSQDGDVEELVERIGSQAHLAESEDEVVELLEDVEEDEECLLFLDYDLGKKEVEKFNKSIYQNDWIIRIVITSTHSVKELKKHQKGKTSAHGYILKPLTYPIYKSVLNDLKVSHLIESEEIFEEGQTLPEINNLQTQASFKAPSSNDLLEEDDDEDYDLGDDSQGFDPSEFKVSTEVRSLIDMHSVKGERPPYEGDLNDKIQAKFNSVFPQEEGNYSEDSGESVERINLREETSPSLGGGGISLDLDDEELEANLMPESVELDEDVEVELDSEDDVLDLGGNEEDLGDGELDFSIEEDSPEIESDELDLSTDEDLVLGDDDLGGEELDLGSEDDSLPEESGLDFDLSDALEESDSDDAIEDIEPLEARDEEQIARELEDLTQNRELPSAQELSEFDEETGDFEVPEELIASMDEEDTPTGNEGAPMSDDTSDDVLEFDDELVEDEGELAFSTEDEPSSDLSVEEEGGLDFNLGDIDDIDEDDEGAGVSSLGGLEAALDDEDTLLPDANDLEEPSAASDSQFDDDELSFSDDEEEEELEKTEAINLADVKKSSPEEESVDFGIEGDELSSDDELDLDSGEGLDEIDLSETEESDDFDLGDDSLDADLEEEAVEFGSEEELTGEFEDDLEGDLEEETNPTMVMTQEIKQDVEDMVDEEVSTREFRPGMQEETGLMDEDDLVAPDLDDEVDDSFESVDFDENSSEELETQLFDEEGDEDDILDESLDALSEDAPKEAAPKEDAPKEDAPTQEEALSHDEGHLKITEDKIPPRFHEGEALRLQATIRQLREEREAFQKEIQEMKRESKAIESENLGLKAELEEAKIEISILKKRHTNELEEMRYRLRLTDEKKLYAEERVKLLQKEFDRLQGKVRVDFNQIKQREKELESQLELAKMDSESQVQSRDKKILDLKRKIDQLEFNMENIVIREQKSRDDKVKLEERLDRIMKTLRGSIEVLEEDRE